MRIVICCLPVNESPVICSLQIFIVFREIELLLGSELWVYSEVWEGTFNDTNRANTILVGCWRCTKTFLVMMTLVFSVVLNRNWVLVWLPCWIITCSSYVGRNVETWRWKTQKNMVLSQRSSWISSLTFICSWTVPDLLKPLQMTRSVFAHQDPAVWCLIVLLERHGIIFFIPSLLAVIQQGAVWGGHFKNEKSGHKIHHCYWEIQTAVGEGGGDSSPQFSVWDGLQRCPRWV